MGERQVVEVLATCTRCGGMSPACHVCKTSGYEVVTLPTPEGSLTSARLRLADAAVRKAEFFAKPMKLRSTKVFPGHEVDPAWQAEREAVDADYDAAVSAVIAFDGAALRTARGEG